MMTIAITREVPERFRGFLASVMLELAPGVYTAPRMTKAVRERVWNVLLSWAGELSTGAWVLLSAANRKFGPTPRRESAPAGADRERARSGRQSHTWGMATEGARTKAARCPAGALAAEWVGSNF